MLFFPLEKCRSRLYVTYAVDAQVRYSFCSIYAQGMNLLTASEIFDVRKDIDPEIWGGSFP